MRLINAQGQEITPGARLRVAEGRDSGQVWLYSHTIEHPVDGHRVHVTRRHPRIGHVHREFHPRVFGLHVEIDITWRRHVVNKVHHVRTKFDEYLLAGVVALFPLAAFEHFHFSEKLFEALGR
jgi:hypothetical protein